MTQRSADTPGFAAKSNALVAQLLQFEIGRMRSAGVPVGDDDYRGLYISDSEADRLLRKQADAPPLGVPSQGGLVAAQTELLAFASTCEGPLATLRSAAQLSAAETAVVLVCLAAESDLGTERLIAYVQDDVSKRRPRVELALRLLGLGDGGRTAFHATAALRASRVVTLHDEPGQPHTPLLARYIALDPRIAQHLLDDPSVDERLAPFVRESGRSLSTPGLPPELDRRLGDLAAIPASSLRPPVLALLGTDRARIDAIVLQLAAGSGLATFTIALPPAAEVLGIDVAWTLATREAALTHAAVVMEGLEGLRPEDRAVVLRRLQVSVAPLVILVSAGGFTWPGLTIEIPPLGHEARSAAWNGLIGGKGGWVQPVLDALSTKFQLSTIEIEDAVRMAEGNALSRSPAAPALNADDLYAAARAQSTPILSGLARKVVPHYQWSDIVLASDPLEQLREMCLMVEHRHLVYETWGFERKLAMGKGLMALFAGQSGTGKTMAADVIAGQLGLDLYKIDLSGVVSKYIGETEKNLGSIFSEAESSNAILFFDEADALFGKRSEVKDAHDRYANIETAYLLQKMEEYSGPVILSTNLKMNLDEAFLRRMHFVVDFPMPDDDDRRRIWQSTLPDELPLGGDIDFDFLARQFKISGGNIRNIVLAAAFLAAADGGPLGMAHMIRATRREFQKLGRMVTETDFGSHLAMLNRDPGA